MIELLAFIIKIQGHLKIKFPGLHGIEFFRPDIKFPNFSLNLEKYSPDLQKISTRHKREAMNSLVTCIFSLMIRYENYDNTCT